MDFTWVGVAGGGDGSSWNDPLNWDLGSSYPQAGDSATFGWDFDGSTMTITTQAAGVTLNVNGGTVSISNGAAAAINMGGGLLTGSGTLTVAGTVSVNRQAAAFNSGGAIFDYTAINRTGGLTASSLTFDSQDYNMDATVIVTALTVTGILASLYEAVGGSSTNGDVSVTCSGAVSIGTLSIATVNNSIGDGATFALSGTTVAITTATLVNTSGTIGITGSTSITVGTARVTSTSLGNMLGELLTPVTTFTAPAQTHTTLNVSGYGSVVYAGAAGTKSLANLYIGSGGTAITYPAAMTRPAGMKFLNAANGSGGTRYISADAGTSIRWGGL